jgi:hypothetical protein
MTRGRAPPRSRCRTHPLDPAITKALGAGRGAIATTAARIALFCFRSSAIDNHGRIRRPTDQGGTDLLRRKCNGSPNQALAIGMAMFHGNALDAMCARRGASVRLTPRSHGPRIVERCVHHGSHHAAIL